MKSRIFTCLFVFTLLVGPAKSWGQYIGEGSNWYFGSLAGCTWCTLQANGDPMYLMNGMVSTNEGVATISDSQCNLLFYTDGITAWNANHMAMTNSLAGSPGGTLKGDPSSTQSGVIIPKPMDPNTYYLFAVDANIGVDGLTYSRVDMTANGGLGNIALAEKNVLLFTPASEKITAVNHSNNIHIWVISHQWNNNNFYAYLVTNTGVNMGAPVISSIGAVHSGSSANSRGYMKASPGGGMFATAIEGLDIYELFDFNNATGQLSNLLTITGPSFNDCYGIEFSADEHFLYGSERWGTDLYQWDVSLPSNAAILASQLIVGTLGSAYGGALQLAPDQKIYMARDGTRYLGRINQPTLAGTACNYVDQAVLLGPNYNQARDSNEGLPTFIATFFNIAEFEFYTDCFNDTVFFTIPNPQGLGMAYWNFNFPSTNPMYQLQSTNPAVTFVYPQGGLYNVRLITERSNDFDTVYADVYFSQKPIVDLGPDVTLCTNEIMSFDLSFNDQFALDGACDYFWAANLGVQTFYASTAQYVIDKPGIYTASVVGDSICGSASDVLVVKYNNMEANLGVDITSGLCAGNVLTLNATYTDPTYGPTTYLWNNNSTGATRNVIYSGIYSVTVTLGLCTDADSIYVHFDNALVPPLGPDKNICAGDTVELNAANPGASYAWSTGMLSQNIFVTNPGIYKVTVTNSCGSIIDNIVLSPMDVPNIDLGPDFTMCIGMAEMLSAYNPNSTYFWSNGQVQPQMTIYNGGGYSVTVTNECGPATDEIYVYGDLPIPNLNLGNDTSVCAGFILDCGYPNMEYSWSNNQTTQSIVINESGDYGLDLINACGLYSDIIHIDLIELIVDLGPDTFLCTLSSSITLNAQNQGMVYNWSNGAITQTTQISTQGTYSLTVTNLCESISDAINIYRWDNTLDLGNDTGYCAGDMIILDAGHPGANYIWTTGAVSQTIEVFTSGIYGLSVSSYCGNLDDNIHITFNPVPVINFGADTLYIVGGMPVVLDPNSGPGQYLWSTGQTTSTISALIKGTYKVTVTNSYGCDGIGKVVVLYPVGIEENEIDNQVILYPNPANGQLFISFGDLRIGQLSVYNLVGGLITEINEIPGPVEIDLQKFGAGIYFVKIVTTDQHIIVKPFSVIK